MDKISIGSRSSHAKLRRSGSNFTLSVEDETYEGVFSRKNGGIIQLNLGEKRTMGFSERNGNEIYVYANGINYVLRKESSNTKQAAVEEENDDIVEEKKNSGITENNTNFTYLVFFSLSCL